MNKVMSLLAVLLVGGLAVLVMSQGKLIRDIKAGNAKFEFRLVQQEERIKKDPGNMGFDDVLIRTEEGRRFASRQELIALAAKYPDHQKQLFIVTFSSMLPLQLYSCIVYNFLFYLGGWDMGHDMGLSYCYERLRNPNPKFGRVLHPYGYENSNVGVVYVRK